DVPQSVIETPKLLDRPGAIQAGTEWTNVQNHYGTNRQKLVQDPKAVEPRLNLALLFMQEARVTGEHGHYYPAALKMLDEAIALQPQDADLLFRTLTAKASVMLSQHEFAEALSIGQRALTMNQYNSGIYGVLVDAHVEMGNYEEAVKMSDKMVSVRPDLRSYSRVSYLREIHGEVDGAIEAMKMAVQAGFPGYEETAWTRLTLGDLYRTYGDDKNAELQYRMTLAEREDYPFAIAALGDLELERGNYEKAEQLLKQAAGIIPEFGFYVSLVDLYQKTGRDKEAKETLDEVFVMLQDDIDSGHNMNLEYADLYLNQAKNLDKALKYALDEYSKRPANISVNKMLAKIYHKRGEQEKAAMHIEKASITDSKDPELLALKN
ncbi:MAG: tetratricopeptide repeat protein, partial [Bacteroidota bacterium]